MHPLTYVRAKPAVPVNGNALVRRILIWLTGHGVRDVVLNLHHRPESVAAVVGDGSDLGVRARSLLGAARAGSAGGPRHALPLLTERGREQFLVVNGDTLSSVDLGPPAPTPFRRTGDHGADSQSQTRQVGGVRLSDGGYVTGFHEGRSAGRVIPTSWACRSRRRRAFAVLDDGMPAESVNMLYPRLLAEWTRVVSQDSSPARRSAISGHRATI